MKKDLKKLDEEIDDILKSRQEIKRGKGKVLRSLKDLNPKPQTAWALDRMKKLKDCQKSLDRIIDKTEADLMKLKATAAILMSQIIRS